MDAAAFLDYLRGRPFYKDQIVYVRQIPPRQAIHGRLQSSIHPDLRRCLERGGLWPLYIHQAEAIDALAGGEHVAVSTPAASGKSLCYNVPVLNALLADRGSRAMYVYPTKALAQDQLKGLREVGEGLAFRADIFDGDTPGHDRPGIKRSTQVLLTNPDMLHLGILPNHRTWTRFLRGLRYIVLDESHVYRGVFGSHVANVIRRLRRLCRLYGSSPQFILCSATIANAGELARQLTGLPFTAIEVDGAPYGGKRFVFWNPPLTDSNRTTRRSTNIEASTLFSELVSSNIRTITFVRTRKVAELVYLYAREQLNETQPAMAEKISPYRASYLPEDRRRIERALFDGELMGVSTTNALELGIDVGTLDATVIAGYPGSIASTWQQAGRSGRRNEESLSVLVGQGNPLDQYLMNYPHTFFSKPVEHALISPGNPYILQPHVLCAAYEAPLGPGDEELFGPELPEALARLEEGGLVNNEGDRWYASTAVGYPAESVNIRSTSSRGYLVVDERSGAVLERVEEASVFHQLHPGAVYLHQGESYLVADLDLESQIAYVEPNDGSYYTQVRDMTDIEIREVRASKKVGGVTVSVGEVEVTNRVLGYRLRKPMTEELLGEEFLDLPERRFNTVALWFDVPLDVLDTVREQRMDLAGGLHAVEHAAIGVLPLFALCDRNDIGGVSTPLHPDTEKPQVFIYDGHPGGIGISERGYEAIRDLWEATLRAVAQCPCDDGCPSCIQSPKCGNNNTPLEKGVAVLMLRSLCGW